MQKVSCSCGAMFELPELNDPQYCEKITAFITHLSNNPNHKVTLVTEMKVIDVAEIIEGNESVAEDIIRTVNSLLSKHGFQVELEVKEETGKVKLIETVRKESF